MDAKKYKMSGHTPLFLLDTIQYLLAFWQRLQDIKVTDGPSEYYLRKSESQTFSYVLD
jgi:hypothetical protein